MPKLFTHWIDIIPAVEIPAAVPVVRRTERLRQSPTVRREVFSSHTLVAECDESERCKDGTLWKATVRVDLDDPQGVAYALLWLRSNATIETGILARFAPMGADVLGLSLIHI